MDSLKLPAALLALFCMVPQWSPGQEASPSPSPPPTRRGIWRADLPGGAYLVRLAAITSVSMHEYLMDGGARITEVNIGTGGSELVRFYCVEPNVPSAPANIGQGAINTVQQRARQVAERVGAAEYLEPVVKNYPTTTHAHTIEYRLADREAVSRLFESIESAWLSGQGSAYKP